MHYIFLKNIVETIITNFVCPECGVPTNEQSVQVLAIKEQAIGLHLICPGCHAHAELHAEVSSLANQLLTNEHGKKFFEEFIKQGGTFGSSMPSSEPNPNNVPRINDADIVKIHQNLQHAQSVADFIDETPPTQSTI
jgi:hypothetical protein